MSFTMHSISKTVSKTPRYQYPLYQATIDTAIASGVIPNVNQNLTLPLELRIDHISFSFLILVMEHLTPGADCRQLWLAHRSSEDPASEGPDSTPGSGAYRYRFRS